MALRIGLQIALPEKFKARNRAAAGFRLRREADMLFADQPEGEARATDAGILRTIRNELLSTNLTGKGGMKTE